jgi:hypothetical protein
MENDKLNVSENENNSNDSSCCGVNTPCCKEEDKSSFSNKMAEVKVAEPMVVKASGGCGCGGHC